MFILPLRRSVARFSLDPQSELRSHKRSDPSWSHQTHFLLLKAATRSPRVHLQWPDIPKYDFGGFLALPDDHLALSFRSDVVHLISKSKTENIYLINVILKERFCTSVSMSFFMIVLMKPLEIDTLKPLYLNKRQLLGPVDQMVTYTILSSFSESISIEGSTIFFRHETGRIQLNLNPMNFI